MSLAEIEPHGQRNGCPCANCKNDRRLSAQRRRDVRRLEEVAKADPDDIYICAFCGRRWPSLLKGRMHESRCDD